MKDHSWPQSVYVVMFGIVLWLLLMYGPRTTGKPEGAASNGRLLRNGQQISRSLGHMC